MTPEYTAYTDFVYCEANTQQHLADGVKYTLQTSKFGKIDQAQAHILLNQQSNSRS